MKIADIVAGESYAVDPWANGSGGVRRIEVTGIETVEERVGYTFGGTPKTRNVRMVRGICREVTASGRVTVGKTVLLNPRAITRTAAEQDARNAAVSDAKARCGAAVAALAAVGVEGHGDSRSETVTIRLTLAEAHELAKRLRAADVVVSVALGSL